MITDPTPYRQTIQSIQDRAGDLLQKFESGDYTYRDLAILNSLYSEYVETLDEISNNGVKFDGSVTVKVDGTAIKFADIDGFASWAAEVLNAAI